MAELDKIVDQLSKLTVMEATELAKKLEDIWGVSGAPTAPSVSQEGPSDIDNDKVTEKSEYDLVLSAIGDKKFSVIKEVKTITGLGLKETKDLVESAPKVIKASLPKDEAEALKKKLEAAGATVELK